MTRNMPLEIGTKVRAVRDEKTIEERIYNVKSVYNSKRDSYENTYWLRGVVGSFKDVTPV